MLGVNMDIDIREIQSKIEDVKKSLAASIEAITKSSRDDTVFKEYTYEDIDIILKNRRVYGGLSWKEENDEAEVVKKKYIECEEVPFENKIAAILK